MSTEPDQQRHATRPPFPSASTELVTRRFSVSSAVIPGVLICIDSLIILSAGAIAFSAIVGGNTDPSEYSAAVAFVWLVSVALMNIGGLYKFDASLNPLAFTDKFVLAFASAFLFLMAAAFSLKVSSDYSRLWTGSFAISAAIATILMRIIAARIIGGLVDRRVLSRNVVVIGAGEQIEHLLSYVKKERPRFVSLLGVFLDDPQRLQHADVRLLGGLDDVASYVRRNDVDDVVISLPWSADEKITKLLDKLRELPVNVYLGADLIGFRLQFRPPPEHFGQMPLVEVVDRPLAGWNAFQKHLIDYVFGVALTVLFLPVMLLIALAVRLESRGPVLFRQERYGFANRIFHIYKFRTMLHSAVRETETVQATRNDPRVTRVGKVLRRFSLDELPQLFNVLNGTMSLVGPRPHAVDHNEAYAQKIRGYFARHRVKPGLSGWAQVNGFRGEIQTVESMMARVKFDVYYVENWTPLFDLKILAMTVVVCLTGRNAY